MNLIWQQHNDVLQGVLEETSKSWLQRGLFWRSNTCGFWHNPKFIQPLKQRRLLPWLKDQTAVFPWIRVVAAIIRNKDSFWKDVSCHFYREQGLVSVSVSGIGIERLPPVRLLRTSPKRTVSNFNHSLIEGLDIVDIVEPFSDSTYEIFHSATTTCATKEQRWTSSSFAWFSSRFCRFSCELLRSSEDVEMQQNEPVSWL
jgi:hypothetical protein